MSFRTDPSFPFDESNFSYDLGNSFLDSNHLNIYISNHGAMKNQLTSGEVGGLSKWLRSTLQDWEYNNFSELQTGSPDGGLGKKNSPKFADLIIYEFDTDELTNFTAGDAFELSVELKNEGDDSASDSITGLYLSVDDQLDAGDELLGQADTRSIRNRRKKKVDFPVTLDEDLTSGTYYLLANADEANDIEESKENNNLGIYQIQIEGLMSEPPPVYPDVVGETLSIDPFIEGDSALSFTYEISNIGDDDAAGSTAQFYLSTDNTFDENDVSLGSLNISAIAAGESQSETLSSDLTETLSAGNYTLFMQADSSNVLDESNEDNNIFGTSFSVTAPPPPPKTIGLLKTYRIAD